MRCVIFNTSIWIIPIFWAYKYSNPYTYIPEQTKHKYITNMYMWEGEMYVDLTLLPRVSLLGELIEIDNTDSNSI